MSSFTPGSDRHVDAAATAHYWSRVLSRRERVKNLLSWPYAWHYVRQTRLVEPLWRLGYWFYGWWLYLTGRV